MRGTVKFYRQDRRFGFLTGEDGADYYFATESLPRRRQFDPVEGDGVQFEPRDSPKGKMAVHITLDHDEAAHHAAEERRETNNDVHDLQVRGVP